MQANQIHDIIHTSVIREYSKNSSIFYEYYKN